MSTTEQVPDRESDQLIFRIYHKQLGNHIHVRLFSGVPGHTFQQNGNLVFDANGADWKLFSNTLFIESPYFIFVEE